MEASGSIPTDPTDWLPEQDPDVEKISWEQFTDAILDTIKNLPTAVEQDLKVLREYENFDEASRAFGKTPTGQALAESFFNPFDPNNLFHTFRKPIQPTVKSATKTIGGELTPEPSDILQPKTTPTKSQSARHADDLTGKPETDTSKVLTNETSPAITEKPHVHADAEVAPAQAVEKTTQNLHPPDVGVAVADELSTGLAESNVAKPIYTNVLSTESEQHILYGDGSGGGHLWPGQPDKTVFPQDWSSEKILQEISDITTSPQTTWYAQTGSGGIYTKGGDPARWAAYATRGGIRIRVVYEPATQKIITAFPDDNPIPASYKQINR